MNLSDFLRQFKLDVKERQYYIDSGLRLFNNKLSYLDRVNKDDHGIESMEYRVAIDNIESVGFCSNGNYLVNGNEVSLKQIKNLANNSKDIVRVTRADMIKDFLKSSKN